MSTTAPANLECRLQADGRIHGLRAYSKLTGLNLAGIREPVIPQADLIKCNSQPGNMLILDAGFSLRELAGASLTGWHMNLADCTYPSYYIRAHYSPKWVVVPMGSQNEVSELDPRLVAMGILLHQRDTGQTLANTPFSLRDPEAPNTKILLIGRNDEECWTRDDGGYGPGFVVRSVALDLEGTGRGHRGGGMRLVQDGPSPAIKHWKYVSE